MVQRVGQLALFKPTVEDSIEGFYGASRLFTCRPNGTCLSSWHTN